MSNSDFIAHMVICRAILRMIKCYCYVCVYVLVTVSSVEWWLSSLASNHILSPLCGSSPTSGNSEDLSQYDPGC